MLRCGGPSSHLQRPAGCDTPCIQRSVTSERPVCRRQHNTHLIRCLETSTATAPSEIVEKVRRVRPQSREATSRDDSASIPEDLEFEVPDWVHERNNAFTERIHNRLILAPLTKGGNLPFRRLCSDFGAEVTMSEMAFTKQLLKGDRVEKARMVKASNEICFGFQVATKTISDGVAVSKLAAEAGASWLDINCGCPIYEATRRGLGAALLRKPKALAKMVAGIVLESALPVTVKIRTGESEKKINAPLVAELLHRAGAAAVTIHGRTMEQRYKRPADWSLISSVTSGLPQLKVIGNGDVLTHYEADKRMKEHGCHAVMVGRGALIKPWLFQEHKEGRELLLSAGDRVGIYRKLASYMKEHFGDDSWGKSKAFYFLPSHFAFFYRYRHMPASIYGAASLTYPLLNTRLDLAEAALGEELDSLPLIERLLRCENEAAHMALANTVWDSSSDADAMAMLENLASEQLPAWEAEVKAGAGGRGGEERESEG